MGCQSSTLVASRIDDSIHAMLEQERKRAAQNGEKPVTGFAPRRHHPLLKPICCSEDDRTVEDSLHMACYEQYTDDSLEFQEEAKQILYHTKNHTNTIDKRDLRDLNSGAVQVFLFQ